MLPATREYFSTQFAALERELRPGFLSQPLPSVPVGRLRRIWRFTMHHPWTGGEDARLPVVCNPAALWRRTSSSVVVLPPGGEPTELIGAAAAVWDAVTRPELGGRLVEGIDASEVEQIIDAFTQLDLVVAA